MEWFDAAILLIDVFVAPAILLGFGWRFMKKPPQDINGSYGYRTSMSMKNQDTWQFAHHYCGKLWYWLGLIMLPLSVVPMLLVFDREIGTVGRVGAVICFAQAVPMVGAIIPTEMALKRTFDKSGRRKTA